MSDNERYIVNLIKAHRKLDKKLREFPDYCKYELLINWEGYDSSNDSWEPLETLEQDAPEMVNEYFAGCKLQVSKRKSRGLGGTFFMLEKQDAIAAEVLE